MSETTSQTTSQTETDEAAAGTASASGLYVPAKSKSPIWNYFKLKKDDVNKDKVWAVCNKCPNKKLAFRGATTTLWNHVEQVHFIPKPKTSKQGAKIRLEPQVDSQDVETDSEPNPSTTSNTKQMSIKEAFARYCSFLN